MMHSSAGLTATTPNVEFQHWSLWLLTFNEAKLLPCSSLWGQGGEWLKWSASFPKEATAPKHFILEELAGAARWPHIVPPLLLNLLPANSLFLTQLHGIPELCLNLKFLICTTPGTQSFLNMHSYPRQSYKCENWPTCVSQIWSHLQNQNKAV